MEFDNTARDTSQGITNADRLAASTKRLTIAPIHEIAADEPTINAREDIDPAIPMTNSMVYIASESEDTNTSDVTVNGASAAPPKVESTSFGKLSIIFGGIITALGIVGMAIFLQLS